MNYYEKEQDDAICTLRGDIGKHMAHNHLSFQDLSYKCNICPLVIASFVKGKHNAAARTRRKLREYLDSKNQGVVAQ